jgi:hypothetical protein
VTEVDVGGILQHGNAVGSTVAHSVKLAAIAAKYSQSQTIQGWIDLVRRMKELKITIRSAQLVASAIPIPYMGLATSLGTAIAKLGIKLTTTKGVLGAAAELHWRAYQENVLTRGKGTGPASEILTEIFTRRGATRIFGQYDIERFVKEPNGWLAVADKIGMI